MNRLEMEIEKILESSTIAELQQAYRDQQISITEVTEFFIARINATNPTLHAVIAISPEAVTTARQQDEMLASGAVMGPLFGIPILIKDNIETRELPTTAGSLALADNLTGRDAPVVAQLRSAGAIILGKANLSEWANFRSQRSSSGWSALGGQTGNAHDPLRSPCGSSSGSAVGVAALLAVAALGTETNGSVVCPASVNGVVGIKPTIGLVPQAGIVPISHSQDTAGPLTRNVTDAQILLRHMTTSSDFDGHVALDADALRGKRIGILRSHSGFHEGVDLVFEKAVETIRGIGAEIVDDLKLESYEGLRADTFSVLLYEFKTDLNEYLKNLPNDLNKLTLERLIVFNQEHEQEEMPFFKQEIFERAEEKGSLDEPEYTEALHKIQNATGAEGISRLMQQHKLDALVAPTRGPAWTIDLINGDHGKGGFSTHPAVSGYPHITLPMGKLHDLPLGISFTAGPGSDDKLIAYAYSFEQHANIDIRPPTSN